MKSEAIENLVVAYRRIGDDRMRDLPFYNDRLSVEAVGFRTWRGRSVGILIAPWFMNLALLSRAEDEWDRLAPGETVEWEFPSGVCELDPIRIDDVNTYLSAPLFSTVQDFPDQETACAVAEKILENLFQPPQRTGRRAPVTRRDVFTKLLLGGTEA